MPLPLRSCIIRVPDANEYGYRSETRLRRWPMIPGNAGVSPATHGYEPPARADETPVFPREQESLPGCFINQRSVIPAKAGIHFNQNATGFSRGTSATGNGGGMKLLRY